MSLYDLVKSKENPLDGYTDFMITTVREKRFLSSVQLELIPLCNFSCPFCYARLSPKQLEERGERVLRFEDWKPIIDGLAEMNVFDISFSGGECTLHPDFEKIYRYAYEKNFNVSIITNGSNITDSILEMFCECPPKSVTITMYGGSPESYQKVCGNADFYERVIINVKKLSNKKINFKLQSTISKDNLEDMEPISKFAEEFDVPYITNMDYISFRSCDSDKIENNVVNKKVYIEFTEKALRHTTEMIESVHKTGKSDNERKKYFPKEGKIIEKGIQCSAGRDFCAFNYKGEMQLCVTLDAKKIDTKGRKISDCWQELVEYADNVPCLVECQNCIHKMQCRTCIDIHYNDIHEFGKPSPRLCYKRLYPENAKEIEEFYEKNGYVLLDMYKYER